MRISKRQLSAGLIGAALALPVFPAEQTLNVTTVVEIDVPDAVVTGIEDLQMQITEVPGFPADPIAAASEFCLFTPTNFFSMTITGASTDGAGGFLLTNADPNDPLTELEYDVGVFDIFSDPANPAPIGGGSFFANGVTESAINSSPFNTDATCTDGENLALIAQIVFGPGSGQAIEQIADGQPHNFTDTLTILVEPEF